MNAPPARSRILALALGGLVAVMVIRLLLASELGLLADEAYYLLWSRELAWGYYDQPPLIAALLAWVPLSDPAPGLVRAPALLCGGLGMASMAWVSQDRAVALGWWLGVPALFGLTLFSTPDAPLLAAWAGVVAAASVGGRGWLVAGVLWALAILSKHPGTLALPLALLALGPRELRSRWPWIGAGLGLLLILPHLSWLAAHDGITLRFQLTEGFVARRPGLIGPLRLLGEQSLVLGPLTLAAVLLGLRHQRWTRAARIGGVTALGVLLLFLVASPFGEPEAHWPAPAWVGLGFVAAAGGAHCRRLLWAGLGLGLLGALGVGLIAAGPLGALSPELRGRFTEAEELRGELSALPEGPILAERYQEAALARVVAGREIARPATCGREDHLRRFGPPSPRAGWALRPTTAGPSWCTDPAYRAAGPVRDAGRWQARWVEVR